MNPWLHIPKADCHFIIGLHGCNRGINYGRNMVKGMRGGGSNRDLSVLCSSSWD
jgi:hypothetical protein